MEVTNDKVAFVPVQKLHLLEKGALTEQCDFTFNLDAKLKKDLREIKVGDVKEFHLTVQVITDYEKLELDSEPSTTA